MNIPQVAACAFALFFVSVIPVFAQVEEAPPRAEGDGPHERLIIRGATLVDGTGAPARGPVDIVVEGDRITEVRSVGSPGVDINEARRPEEGTREIDAEGMYVLPGLVDLHAHTGGSAQGTPSEYVFKLWMAHGITTVRENSSGNGIDWTLTHRERSAANEITAPRIVSHVSYGRGHDGPIRSAEEAREWVREIARRGADGIKFFSAPPDQLEAALDEAREQGLRTSMHHAQLGTAETDVLHTARWGLNTIEHFYGYPEALFTERTIQEYPSDYNYNDEYHRFSQAGRMWQQAAEPGSEHWDAVLDSLLYHDVTMVPTFNIYEASRDLMRARRAEWHDRYTLPSLWEFFRPDREAHGSYFFYWTSDDEAEWSEHYRRWMTFVRDFKNRGGQVAAGSDSGFIFQLYGFGFVRELEMLREAGFSPLEVIRAATLSGARAMGMDDEIGTVAAGKKADLIIVEENPLENLKVLYGTGAIRLNDETNRVERVGGVRWTIKDGIVFDAPALLRDVEEMVRDAKSQRGWPLDQPLPLETP